MNREQLEQAFIGLYGPSEEKARCFYAPGRVNLIGEHTDYNGGYVFPAALNLGTFLLIRPRREPGIAFASTDFDAKATIDPASIVYDKADDWINYPKGVLYELGKEGHTFGGYEVLYHGIIPNGAGLSSSASIQLVTGFAFLTMEGRPVDRVQLALLAQRSENEFLGVKCGIMDQFAVAMGQRDHAILLKCDTLDYERVPFESTGYKLVIGNTNKRRGLVDSAYNERREQCEQAVQDLRAVYPELNLLGELSLEQFEQAESAIREETVRRRARHVVEENERVLASVDALKRNDLAAFGRLMDASHESLRTLYEVSCRELDILVEEARRIDGVLGSRMTGAGFGGCTVSLVREDSVDRFIEQVGTAYATRSGLKADFYVCKIGDGVTELD
ncbi:galactokinase [Paenibacillus sp. J31TS4]|uniref:galactokinase n=1 Tax=Paenibacillus sp. J31TS4 TaxID=2807195 RepID=UPI001BD09FA5|nr:galactokinase [Paenibacillus sp. J31TS4]